MAAICRLFDFLYSEEGQRLVYCGIAGEDYDVVDGEVVMKDGVDLMEKYTFKHVNRNIADLAMWNPEYWDSEYPCLLYTSRKQNVQHNSFSSSCICAGTRTVTRVPPPGVLCSVKPYGMP